MCVPCKKRNISSQENDIEIYQKTVEEENQHENEAPEMEFFNETPEDIEIKIENEAPLEIKDGNDSDLETTYVVDQENETPEMELHFLEVKVDVEQENETPEMELHFLETTDVIDVRESIHDLDQENETPEMESHIREIINDIIYRVVSSSESKNLDKVVKNLKILKRTLFLSGVYD